MLQHLRTRAPVLFGLAIVLTGIFLGERWQLYDRIAHFDKFLHVLGGIAAAWMVLALLQDDLTDLGWPKQLLIIVSGTCLVGVLWEFAEYVSNFTRHTHPLWYHYFHGGDLADTMGDLFADIGGGVLLALWALYKENH